MNWPTVRVLLRHEITMLLRDRRTIVVAIVLPIAIMPLAFFASSTMQQKREKNLEQTVYRYAVTGSRAKQLREAIARDLSRGTGAEEIAPVEGSGPATFQCEEVGVTDPEASLKSKEIHFYLEALSGSEADALPQPEKKSEASPLHRDRDASEERIAPEPERLPGVPLVRLYYQADRDDSSTGRSRMRALLQRERQAERDSLLGERGFAGDSRTFLPVEDKNIASANQVTGSMLGRFLTFFLLMLMLSGGSVVALDSIAGEKERGSLETLLTTAANRVDIVAAKQILIASVGVFITVVQAANILIYVHFKLVRLPGNFQIAVAPGTILVLLLLYIPMAALVAAVLMMISAYAKSYKEAMLYFFPVYLVSMVPGFASVLPGISLRSAIVLVPIANVSVAAREVLVGKFDWPMLVVTFCVMAATAGWANRSSARMLSNERLITASDMDIADIAGGPALFPRHVLRWYAVLIALLFAIALNVPALATFRAQVLFNELVLFLGASLLMIWRYRLNIRAALALRKVKPIVWITALLIIPSGHLASLGVFRLANLVFPVPRRILEQFAREVMPRDVPVWQVAILLTILPGICEEIAFRGTLLYGLRKKFRPVVLALAVGIVFGLFHISLFRILPTAFLGVVLTAIALLTGSILPGILVHAGNNAFALWAGMNGYPLGTLHWWHYAGGTVIFLLCMYVLYRVRTPYPDLRGSTAPDQ
jgi:sodium transport system permease protein